MGRHDLAGQRAFAQGEPVFALPTALQALRLAGPDAFALLSALTTLPPGALAAKGQSAAPGGRPPAASSPNLARGATGRPAPSRPPAIEGAVGAAGAVGAVGAAGAAGAVGAVGAAPGEPAIAPAGGGAALLLDASGHIRFGLTIAPLPDGLLLLTDGDAAQLAAFLNARRFRRRAEAAALPQVEVLATRHRVADPAAWGALATAQDNWPGAQGRPDGIGPKYAAGAAHPGRAWSGLGLYAFAADAPEPLPARLAARGWRQVDAAALEALRIAAWRPLATREAADGATLPHELDWLRSTTPPNSGCYPGQETVAKVVNTGKPPRRLVFLHLDGSEAALPAPGAAVRLAARPANAPGLAEAGRVTSAAIHFELGPIALALVKRSTPAEAGLAVAADAPGGWIAASQTVIVPPSGESDSRPARRAAPPKLALRRAGRR